MILPLLVATVLAVSPGVAPGTTALVHATRGGESRPLKDCMRAFEALHEANDGAGCVTLWRENPHWVLVTLASDVEGALARLEAGTTGPKVEAVQQRALWGARHAVDAGLPIVLDYVASIAGLDEYRRTLYRDAQRIYERATGELADGEHELALEVARESVQRATDLGDWWGAAMAYTTVGECHRALGSFEDAIIAYGHARNLYQGLGLLQNEYASLVAMATMASALEHDVRGIALTHAALTLHDRLLALVPDYAQGADPTELLRVRATMEARTGDKRAAAATRQRIEALEAR